MAKNSNKKIKRKKVERSVAQKQLKRSAFTGHVFVDIEKDFFGKIHDSVMSNTSWGQITEASHLKGLTYELKFTHDEKRALNRLIRWARLNGVIVARDTKVKLVYGSYEETDCANSTNNKNIITMLVNIAKEKFRWVGEPEHFRSSYTNSATDKVYALANHIFCKYSVPKCFIDVWEAKEVTKENNTHKEWYFLIGNGVNVRKLSDLPIKLTKKAAHFFGNSPKGFGVNEALRWSMLKGLGLSDRMIGGIFTTPLRNNFDNEDFWETVIHFYKNNPFLDMNHYRNIYDYINTTRHSYRREFVDGEMTNLAPENPNFSMKGRDPNVLMEQVHAWHAVINNRRSDSVDDNAFWEPCGVKPLSFKEDDDHIAIVELLSYFELKQEGRKMRHCVGSYANSCIKKKCAIFSLRKYNGKDLLETFVTIEVSLERKPFVSQMRKKCNASPLRKEVEVVKIWARENNMEVSKYIDRED
jgi:hypothetical protein